MTDQDEAKPREWWILQWEPCAGADNAWRSQSNCDLALEAHGKFRDRPAAEKVHVIEYSAYQEAVHMYQEKVQERDALEGQNMRYAAELLRVGNLLVDAQARCDDLRAQLELYVKSTAVMTDTLRS